MQNSKSNLFLEGRGLRLRKLPLRDRDDEVAEDLERDREREVEREEEPEDEREGEWDSEDEPDAEPEGGERRPRIGFFAMDNGERRNPR